MRLDADEATRTRKVRREPGLMCTYLMSSAYFAICSGVPPPWIAVWNSAKWTPIRMEKDES